MVYHNVAEIFDDMQATRNRLWQRVEKLSRAQADFKRAPDAWSVAEILEHLGKVEQYLVKLFGRSLPAGDVSNGKTLPVEFQPFSMDSHVESTRDLKLESPEVFVPAGGLPLRELLRRLRAIRDELLALRPRFEAHDLSQIVLPHPVYGPINLYKFLTAVGLHENRHLRQIEAIMASPGFPASELTSNVLPLNEKRRNDYE